MNATSAQATRHELVARCAARIEAHLARFAAGHDPIGHLFAIERLARAARAEWRNGERGAAPEGQAR